MRDEHDATPDDERHNATTDSPTHGRNTHDEDTQTSAEVIQLSAGADDHQDGDHQEDDDAQTLHLSAEAMAWVRRTVADLGPLDDDEREFLAQIFKRSR